MTSPLTVTLTLRNAKGLHSRAAAKLVERGNQFDAQIKISYNNMVVQELSMMDLLMLSARKGAVITVQASGPDAQVALQSLSELITSGFGEDGISGPSS